jgi:hypothetical protein
MSVGRFFDFVITSSLGLEVFFEEPDKFLKRLGKEGTSGSG